MNSFVALRQKHRIVIDVNTGHAVTVSQVLGRADYGTVVSDYRIRMQIEGLEGTYRYVCPRDDCGDQMILSKVRSRDKDPYRFYFKHRRNENSCAGTAHLSAREICALQFNGAKESAEHLAFKQRIMESVEADLTFGKPDAEKHWVDDTNGRWRQPDVQVMRGDQRLALEVQLSTTFLHVIAERMKFYRDTGGQLIWLFRDLEISNYRQAEDDIFYANNWNAFRVTDQTVERSRAERRFALECGWLEPVIRSDGVTFEERKQQIYFDQLKFDVGRNGAPRAYFFNTEAARERADQVSQTLPWVRRFETYWLSEGDQLTEWDALRNGFLTQGIELPEFRGERPFYQMLNMLYSIKHDRMVGFEYQSETYVRLGHHLFDQHKCLLGLFHRAIKVYGRTAVLDAEDRTEKFRRKADRYLPLVKQRHPDYTMDTKLRAVACFLFPEIDPANSFSVCRNGSDQLGP